MTLLSRHALARNDATNVIVKHLMSTNFFSFVLFLFFRGAIYCSFCLLLLHVLVLGSATMYLKFNGEMLYHYFFAGLTAVEVLFYFCLIQKFDPLD